ncbi:MAG: hypothetical protein AAB757_01415 [Patescibacteria group bacterium]
MRNNSPRFLWLFEILNFLINYDRFFWLIGKFNSRGWIKSVFLAYPADYTYSRKYAYKFRIESWKRSWKVRLTAFLRQNGKIVLMFSIFVEEQELLKEGNKEKLKELIGRVEKIRKLIRADEKTFAGILPGLLMKRKMIEKSPEADITASIIIKAVELVKKEIGLNGKIPVVVLGWRGFIGRRVIHELKSICDPNDIYTIDLDGENKWPGRGNKIVLNVARGDTIEVYLPMLREGDIILNEAYPPPGQDNLGRIKELGCECFHIVGVEAFAFPRFPHGYKGGIPCCAAWTGNTTAIVKKLT